MFTSLLLSIILTSSHSDPVAAAIASYSSVVSYRVTLRSRSEVSYEIIRYYYKRPGFVRMEFTKPHNGAVIVYNPLKREARLRPFPWMNSFILTLSPENRLIKDPRGHMLDKSDIGVLLKAVMELQKMGKTEILKDEAIGGRPSIMLKVEGNADYVVDGVHRYILWLDKVIFLPLKAASFDKNGRSIEEVLMDDLEVNIDLPDSLFDQ